MGPTCLTRCGKIMPIFHTNTFNETQLNADGSASCLKFDGLHTKLRKQHDKLISSGKNFVVADFSVIFKTTAGKVLSLSIPIRDSAWKSFGYESLKQSNEISAMTDFYKAHKDIGGKGKFHPQSHGHSEAYLYYYLQSSHRLTEILNHLMHRGLEATKVQQILEVRLHICTTNSVCGTCTDLTLGTHSKDGFIQSFSAILQHAFSRNNFQVAPNFKFQVCPSYTKDYGHDTDITHLNPSYLMITHPFTKILEHLEALTYLQYLRAAKQKNATNIDYRQAKMVSQQRKDIAAALLSRESLTDRFNVTSNQPPVIQNIRDSIWISQHFAHTGFVSSSKDVEVSRTIPEDEKDIVHELGGIAHKTLLKFFRSCKQKKEDYERLVSESWMSSGL